MRIYFSETTQGFYSTELFPIEQMPEDVIKITETKYQEMLDKKNNHNKHITIVNGKPVYKDQVINNTWDMIRAKRNELLKSSDYTQLPDYPGNKTLWAAYRQELRDITNKFSNPNEVIWPVEPK